jgi:hypothetical protein
MAHIATPEFAAPAKKLQLSLERAPRRCAAIPHFRRSRNAHINDGGPASRARKTAFRTLRSATARRPQIQKDDPPPTGASIAASSRHDNEGRLKRDFRSSFFSQE